MSERLKQEPTDADMEAYSVLKSEAFTELMEGYEEYELEDDIKEAVEEVRRNALQAERERLSLLTLAELEEECALFFERI